MNWMRSFDLLLMFGLPVVTSAQPPGQVYKNKDSTLTWWERSANKYTWVREHFGERFKFRKSIGVIVAIGDYNGQFD